MAVGSKMARTTESCAQRITMPNRGLDTIKLNYQKAGRFLPRKFHNNHTRLQFARHFLEFGIRNMPNANVLRESQFMILSTRYDADGTVISDFVQYNWLLKTSYHETIFIKLSGSIHEGFSNKYWMFNK